jgi:probable rRNA maturation factor
MIEIEVEDPAWRSLEDVEGVVARAAAAALQDHPSALSARTARFRAKDQPTNVLAFPAPAGPGASLGDIALAAGVCAREAAAQGKAPDAHLAHLVVHGVLHLLGYDHMEDREAEAMEARERTVLAGLGIADPYGAEARGG